MLFTKSQPTPEVKKPVSSAHTQTHTHKLNYPPKLLIRIKKKSMADFLKTTRLLKKGAK